MVADDEGFAGLALRLRGRSGLTQRELAASLGIHVRSVQLWEASTSHPNAARLQGLIRVFLDAGGFAGGTELEEAEALWLAAMSESPRLNTSFDAAWFSRLCDNRPGLPPETSRTPQPRTGTRQHWGGAPDVTGFLSRDSELATLRRWMLRDNCRVVCVLGMGGIGKTLLAARAAHDLEPYFEFVYWRSLQNAPTFGDWLSGAIGFLSPRDAVLTATDDARLNRLMEIVAEAPTLLVLDNVETILKPGERTGGYIRGYAGYGELFNRLAQTPHRSCLLLTSREEPPELGPLKGAGGPTRTMGLGGLDVADARVLLRDKMLRGTDGDWRNLVARYTGNGLALKLIGESIHELFGGAIGTFLDDISAHGGLYGGVRQLLETQIERLSDIEQRTMRRLAVEREPLSFAEIAASLGDRVTRGEAREAVEALLRRSLLERREPGPTFALQAVVLEFVTDQVVDEAARSLARAEFNQLRSQPLLSATAKDYVLRGQERLIARPVLDRLLTLLGNSQKVEHRLLELIDELRGQPRDEQGYGPGNAINLLRLLRGDLKRIDLSGLLIRNAYLSDTEAQDASFAGAHLTECVLAEAFHQVSVALSPDGAHLLAGTTSGEVCLWRAADRTLLLSMAGHGGTALRVAMSTERGLAASASEDGTVRLWHAGSGQPLAALEGHTDFVQAVAFSGDGRLLASGSQDGTVKLWQAPEGKLLRTMRSPGGSVLSAALSRDATVLVCGLQDGSLVLWDPTTGKRIDSIDAHTGPVSGLALSSDGRTLASASLDGTATLWDLAMRASRSSLVGHSSGISNVALSHPGDLVATAGQDGTVRLWSAADGEPLTTLLGHTGEVWDVSLTADGNRIASAGQDGAVRFSDSRTGQLLTSLQGHSTAVWDVDLSADGSLVASGRQDGTITIWESASGAMRHRLSGHTGTVVGVALSRDGRVLASASQDGSIKVWDVRSGQLHATLVGHGLGAVWEVVLSRDGSMLVSGSFDGTIRLWDVARGQPLTTVGTHSRGVRAIAMAENDLVVSGSQDGMVRLWDARAPTLLATMRSHHGSVQAVSIDGEGRVAASGGFDGMIKLWDVAARTSVRTLQAHRGGVLCVVVSRDGELVVSGGFDQLLKIWSVKTGQILATLAGHTGAVWGVALTADGSVVASGSFDGTTRLWDASSGTCRQTFQVDRPYERMDITGLTGISPANRSALTALGAITGPGLVERSRANGKLRMERK
jgi:WD40 repeat protein/transcriptional regulator with XRE-family HTH domain